jgi:hypothetical protein
VEGTGSKGKGSSGAESLIDEDMLEARGCRKVVCAQRPSAKRSLRERREAPARAPTKVLLSWEPQRGARPQPSEPVRRVTGFHSRDAFQRSWRSLLPLRLIPARMRAKFTSRGSIATMVPPLARGSP